MSANAVNVLLPTGRQLLEIVESAYEPGDAGDAMILKCKAQIIGGEFDGRPYYMNYCLEHRDSTCDRVTIGQRHFAALRRATGVHNPQDSAELHFKPFGVVIGVGASKDTGEPDNVIRDYVFGRAA